MRVSHSQVRAVELAAQAYARSHARFRPVSMHQALRSIRARIPECGWCDEELIRIAATNAVKQGHAVEFDVSG